MIMTYQYGGLSLNFPELGFDIGTFWILLDFARGGSTGLGKLCSLQWDQPKIRMETCIVILSKLAMCNIPISILRWVFIIRVSHRAPRTPSGHPRPTLFISEYTYHAPEIQKLEFRSYSCPRMGKKHFKYRSSESSFRAACHIFLPWETSIEAV